MRSLLDQALDRAKTTKTTKTNNVSKSYKRKDTIPSNIEIGRLASSEKDRHFYQSSEIADLP